MLLSRVANLLQTMQRIFVFMRSSALLLSSFLASHTSAFCKKLGIILLLLSSPEFLLAQDTLTNKSELISKQLNAPTREKLYYGINKQRVWLVTGVNIAGYGTSLILFSKAWYKNYPHTSFHTFNDSKEWLQVDKIGHAWAAYNTGRASAALWSWAGLSHKKATLIGGFSSTIYLTVIEFLDAHSEKWGWSWSDMTANIFGSGFFTGQELLWNQQCIQYKFSFHHKNYGETMLNQRADDLFGKTWYERMLKDYNAQTYWLSANLKFFFPKSNLPAWLNVSVGYGADGMFGGFENIAKDANGNITFDRRNIPRKRQFYLAPDIDFTKIKTKSKFFRTVFSGLNAFKFPAPALMIDSKGKFRAYAIYF
jgi:uncharacterized protein YfiM (DUF2279 family)